MEMKSINGLTLYYDPEELGAAEVIQKACQQGINTIKELWHLSTPDDCRVYILTSWPRCVFQGAPLRTQILLGLTLPLWYSKFKKLWEFAGGWAQEYKNRRVVGIKSPRLIEHTFPTKGDSIFIQERNIEDKVLLIVSHELAHAFSSHLGLPSWLREGIAMVSADHSLGRPTVKPDTLNLLRDSNQKQSSPERINLQRQSQEDIALLYVRGYWITSYLLETHPDLVRSLLKKRISHEELEESIATTLGLAPDQFWVEIDNLVATHFTQEMT